MTTRRRMTAAAWWAVAVGGMSVMMSALLLVSASTSTDLALGFAGIGLLLLGWFALGHPRAATEAPSSALVIVVAVAAGLAVAGAPTLAIVQAVVYPIAWVFSRSTAQAIGNNLVIAVGVTIGFFVSLGVEPDQLPTTALTMLLSLGFSIAMGLWISRMTTLGEERGRLLAELQGAQSTIAAMHRDAGATAEREHLARELHDTIAQDLTGLVMLAQRAQRELGDDETLRLIEESARATLAETRSLVAAGAALGDEATDLRAALTRLAERFSRETGVDVACTIDPGLTLTRDAEVVVLRCVQEALGNARKHARASRISVIVAAAEGDGERVRVEIADDGIGFDPTTARDGFGLSGLTDRLALVRGSLAVQSSPGSGTTLVAELPSTEVAR